MRADVLAMSKATHTHGRLLLAPRNGLDPVLAKKGVPVPHWTEREIPVLICEPAWRCRAT